MAKTEQEGNEAFDKKAAKRAEKMRKKEEKKQKKAEKGKNAAENPEEEEKEGGAGGKIAMALITLLIIVIWIGILALLVKLDVGGFGSTVLHPILKDVPYVNKILPEVLPEEGEEEPVVDVQYPYATLEEAINRIKELEVELSQALESSNGNSETISQLQAEIARLQEFESEHAKFQEEKTKFYQEVVFADQAPGPEAYKAYYESIDAANAAELYKQVVQDVAYDEKVQEYAKTYSTMKPKQAAAIMEAMTDDLDLVVKILSCMKVEERSDILGAMDTEIAAQLTKLMEPSEP